ncbi:MAG: hypothetical protein SOW55_07130 [Bacilli bacterium]|nr:hypothetical protein [Bacilli bacterium]
MQIIKFILIVVLLFPLKITKEDKLFFYEASLVFYNQTYHLTFKKIEHFYKYFIVEVNDKVSMYLKDITSIERIDLPFLEYGKNNQVKIRYQDNYNTNIYYFNVNLLNEIDITSSGYFSFNDLIEDYMNIIETSEELFISIDPNIYEYKESENYLDLKKLGEISFNQKYDLCKEIVLHIYNEGMFLDLDFLNYYEFKLNLVSNLEKFFLTLKDYLEEQIYLPKENSEKVVNVRIIFKGIYHSDIDVYYDRYIDIDYFVFNEEGRYKLVIEDE